MRWSDIYIGGCASALGRPEAARTAVADGRYEQSDLDADGYYTTRVAADDEMLDLAVEAARSAVHRAGVRPSDAAVVVHASCGHQRPRLMAPASYVQHCTVGGSAPAFELNQHSNGSLLALEMAAAYLERQPTPSFALITAAEPIANPNKYRSEKGIVFGDGATALVLTTGTGVARVVSTSVVGDCTYADLPQAGQITEDGGAEFLIEHGERLMQMVESLTRLQQRAIAAALDDAGLVPGDITRWVFANTGQTQVDWEVRRAFGIETADTTWEWGRQVGHLGAGDQVGGLAYLLETGQVQKGDRVAMCGVGYGFTVSCIVVEILTEPRWEPAAA